MNSLTRSASFLPGAISNVSGNTEMLMGIAKLSLTDRGYARPYFLAGLGVALYAVFSMIERRVTGWATRKNDLITT